MLMTERHIVKSLHQSTNKLSGPITDQDSLFIIDAVNAAMKALLDATEPINKTHQYHQKARVIAETLEVFIRHRENENWSISSTYPYPPHGKKKANRKRA